jgi:hypothetical protein
MGGAKRCGWMNTKRMTADFSLARRRLWVVLGVGSVGLGCLGRAHAQAPVAQTIEGMTFAAEAHVAGVKLPLNGVGLRQVAWLKGYACGLYLPRKTQSATEALAMPGPKRIAMRMLIDGPSEEFAKAFKRGLGRNALPGQLPGMQARADRFEAIIRGIGKLKKGDAVDVEWRPGAGTVALVNGKAAGEAVPGEEVFLAILKIYIGDKPTDPVMKAALLGTPVAAKQKI